MNDTPVASTSSRRKRRPNATPEEKAEWARRFAESGLRQSEFCRQHGLGQTTLQRWLAQVHGKRQDNRQSQAEFVEVQVAGSSGVSRWAAELCRPNGAVLRLAHDVSARLLEQLLRAC